MTTTASEQACVGRIAAALEGVPPSRMSRSLRRLLSGEVERPRLPHVEEAARLSGRSRRWLALGEGRDEQTLACMEEK